MFTRRNRDRRHRTEVHGVFRVERHDGTQCFVATWTEQRPLEITDPLASVRWVTVEREAATFDEACRLQARGQERQRRRRPPPSRAQQMGERIMAGKWFEYWVRR